MRGIEPWPPAWKTAIIPTRLQILSYMKEQISFYINNNSLDEDFINDNSVIFAQVHRGAFLTLFYMG